MTNSLKTTGDWLRDEADKTGIPLRTLAQVQQCMAQCKRQKSDKTMARLMLKVGRMTDEASAWLSQEYPQ